MKCTRIAASLALGAIAAISVGQVVPPSKSGTPQTDAAVAKSDRPIYLRATILPGDTVKFANPFADQGKTFYVTDIYGEGEFGVLMPPELTTATELLIVRIAYQPGSGDNTLKSPISFNTPLPIQTKITLVNRGVGSPSPQDIILAGYVSVQPPKVVDMPVVE
ncbi:MAG: hypothetical protein H6817_01975 [Phycisphaerales bacterium]|nr:hypothetical protein [Phycisphaerales bacterium]